MGTRCLQGCLSSCRAATQLQCYRATSVLTACLGGVARRVGDGAAAPSSPSPSARRRLAVMSRVAGLEDIPTSNTPLPPLAGGATSPGTGSGAAAAGDQADDGFVAPAPEEWAKHDLLMAGCEPGKRLRVAVLLSGGVDSSLALRLLTAAGHSCTAFYLQIWFQEDFRNFWDACPWEEDLGYAQKVCASLGVPLEMVPMTDQYWERVVSSSVAEIRSGRTPNPDIWCNSRVKFGAFYDYLHTQHGSEFDRVASGHYARVERGPRGQRGEPGERLPAAEEEGKEGERVAGSAVRGGGGGGGGGGRPEREVAEARGVTAAASTPSAAEEEDGEQRRRRSCGEGGGASVSGRRGGGEAAAAVAEEGEAAEEEVRLMLTPDAVKDQTYFLANLSPAQLSRVMFPLGCLTKAQVRKLAAAADLANKNRKDSQGICFLGKVKFHEFVKEHLGEWPGPILEAESGKPLGMHAGYWFYTVGQRGGIKLPGGPWYVVAKDTLHNAVLVSRQYYDDAKQRNTFACGPFNWLDPAARPDTGPHPAAGPLLVKVRHGPNVYRCSLRLHDGAGREVGAHGSPAADSHGSVVLEANDQGLAAGQYAVFYQGGRCLGSAVITGTGASAVAAVAGAAPVGLGEGEGPAGRL